MFQNGENIPIDGEIDDSNTKNKKKNNSRRKNKTSGKKRNNNKTRNNRRRNNTGHNGRYLWYSVFTVDELLVSKLILFQPWKIFILIQQLVRTNTKTLSFFTIKYF